MSESSYQVAKYESQLPKKKQMSWPSIFNYIAGSASILAIVTAPKFFPQENIPLAYSVGLVALVASLLIHTYLKDRRKLNRYSSATLYQHYINHIIRDSLAEMENNDFSSTDTVLSKVVDSISNCYSLLTSKQCRCTIKELNDDLTIKTVVRDSISKNRMHLCHLQDKEVHRLEENTDFYNLWYSVYGCSRFFFCKNLITLYKSRQYKNSSFKILGKPDIQNFLRYFSYVKNWKLPYRSTIVLPIRYFSEFTPPAKPESDNPAPHKKDYPHWKFWGFLCIDCNSRNIFDSEFAPELGAAFADILYIYLTQAQILLDRKQKKIIKDSN